jgi:type IV secretion system protein VirB2
MQPNAVASSIVWVENALLGSVAVTIATLAIGALGLMMLTGRMDVRRGVQAVVGCFVIFGASSIASGMISAFDRSVDRSQQTAPGSTSVGLPPEPGNLPVRQYDPYAGAAIPRR